MQHGLSVIERLRQWWRNLRREKSLGERGEDAAVRFLRRLGYRILQRQHYGQHRRFPELDIVAADGDRLVFVEVKTRRSIQKGRPAEAVTPAKQRQIAKAALAYLKYHRLMHRGARFDVIAILWPERAKRPEITHIKHAFTSPW